MPHMKHRGLLYLMFFVLCYVAAKNFQALPGPIRRHPLLALHLLTWCLIFASWQLPPDGVDATAWKVVAPVFALIPFIVWRCSYMLLSGQRAQRLAISTIIGSWLNGECNGDGYFVQEQHFGRCA